MRTELLEALEAQRSAPSAAAAAAHRYTALRGELVVGGVYVSEFLKHPGEPLSDPAALCRGLVMRVYEEQQAQRALPAQPSAAEQQQGRSEAEAARLQRCHHAQCLAALCALLEAAPRLLGVLASRPAIDPLVNCLQPTCELGHAGRLWPPPAEPAARAGMDANAENIARMQEAELALGVLLRLTAHAGRLSLDLAHCMDMAEGAQRQLCCPTGGRSRRPCGAQGVSRRWRPTSARCG